MINGDGACTSWRKSSYSASQGSCVEVARVGDGDVGVRDSKDPGGPVQRFTRVGWASFVRGQRTRWWLGG
jgi:hypothetical protein